MCNLVPVKWDSDFFGFPVGRLVVSDKVISLNNEMKRTIKNSGYTLLYVVSNNRLQSDLDQLGLPFYSDIKITFGKKTDSLLAPVHDYIVDAQSAPYNFNEMAALGVSAGAYSRYTLDPFFPKNKFKEMYVEWIRKSLNGILADKVFLFFEDTINGLITVKKKEQIAEIGLVSVNPDHHSKGIGGKLLYAVNFFASHENCKEVFVATQAINEGAIRFYKKNGFVENSRRFIYHLWVNPIK
jgi:dTDP-4-amino-4,6-dideoxy-D-galactose acyltransferase